MRRHAQQGEAVISVDGKRPGTRRGLRYRASVPADTGFDLDVPLAHGDDDPAAYAACIRIARRLRTPGQAPVGLLPADDETVVAPVGIQLAAAMVDLTAEASAFVDGLARLRTQTSSESSTRAMTRFLRPSLAVVTPSREHVPWPQAAAARAAIEYASARFQHVLVDMTGFGRTGELATVLASVRRVVVVATAVSTTERALLDAVALIPRPKRIGVMVVGG